MVKAVLLALLAFAGPLQARLIYVCDADEGMNGMGDMAGDCCYDEDGDVVSPDCDTDAATTVSRCMELVTDEPDQSARSHPTTDRDHSRDLPPATGPPLAGSLPPPIRQPAQRAAPFVVPKITGTDTYLITQRLRL